MNAEMSKPATQLDPLDRLELLVNNDYATDVFFLVGSPGTPMVAHKAIITMASEVLYAQLNGNFREAASNSPEDPIVVQDIQPEIFREVLRFMYCGRANLLLSNVVEIYYASKKYILTKLEGRCEKFLKDALTEDDVLSVFSTNRLHEFEFVNKICLEMITDNPLYCFHRKTFHNLDKRSLELIVQEENINCLKNQLLSAIKIWTKHNNTPIGEVTALEELALAQKDRRLKCRKLTGFSDFCYESFFRTKHCMSAGRNVSIHGIGIFIGSKTEKQGYVELSLKISDYLNEISIVEDVPLRKDLYVHEVVFDKLKPTSMKFTIEVRLKAADMFHLKRFAPIEEITTMKVCYPIREKSCISYVLYMKKLQ